MSEERFDRLEKLMEQLIRAVSNVGAELEEVKTSQLRMEKDYDTKLAALIENTYRETETIPLINAKIDILAKRLFENEAEISLLKRAK